MALVNEEEKIPTLKTHSARKKTVFGGRLTIRLLVERFCEAILKMHVDSILDTDKE